MAEATLYHGSPLFVDYTPGADVTAGAVVVVGKVPFVAHLDIANGDLGSVAARGGVYSSTADGDLAPGDKVYWNDTSNKISKTANAGANTHFGFVSPSSNPAVDGDAVIVIHAPDGTTI